MNRQNAFGRQMTLLMMRFQSVSPNFKLRGQGQLFRFGGSLTLNRMAWFTYSQADVFIAGKILGAQLLGAYSVAVNLANMPMQKMMAISNQVAFSAFAKLQGDPAALAAGILRTLRLSLMLSIGLLWGLAATAPVLVPLLLGNKWVDAIVPLQVLAAIVPLRIASATLSTACIAAGHVSMDLKNNLTGAMLLAPAFAVGAAYGGITGLALAWLIVFPLFFLIVVRRIAGKLGLTTRSVLGELLRPGCAGAVMVGSIALVEWKFSGLPAPLLLGVGCGVGALSFIASVRLLDPAMLKEVMNFVLPSGGER